SLHSKAASISLEIIDRNSSFSAAQIKNFVLSASGPATSDLQPYLQEKLDVMIAEAKEISQASEKDLEGVAKFRQWFYGNIGNIPAADKNELLKRLLNSSAFTKCVPEVRAKLSHAIKSFFIMARLKGEKICITQKDYKRLWEIYDAQRLFIGKYNLLECIAAAIKSRAVEISGNPDKRKALEIAKVRFENYLNSLDLEKLGAQHFTTNHPWVNFVHIAGKPFAGIAVSKISTVQEGTELHLGLLKFLEPICRKTENRHTRQALSRIILSKLKLNMPKAIGTREEALDAIFGNETNARSFLKTVTLLRYVYPYKLTLRQEKFLPPLEFAGEDGAVFKIGPQLYLCPITESFRRHIILSKDNAGNIKFALEIIIPGQLPDRREVGALNRETIAKEFLNAFSDKEYCVRPIRTIELADGAYELYDEKVEFGRSCRFFVLAFEYEDGNRLDFISPQAFKDIAKKLNMKVARLCHFLIEQAAELTAASHFLGYIGDQGYAGTDQHVDNMRLIVRKNGGVILKLVGDFGLFRKLSHDEDAKKMQQRECNTIARGNKKYLPGLISVFNSFTADSVVSAFNKSYKTALSRMGGFNGITGKIQGKQRELPVAAMASSAGVTVPKPPQNRFAYSYENLSAAQALALFPVKNILKFHPEWQSRLYVEAAISHRPLLEEHQASAYAALIRKECNVAVTKSDFMNDEGRFRTFTLWLSKDANTFQDVELAYLSLCRKGENMLFRIYLVPFLRRGAEIRGIATAWHNEILVPYFKNLGIKRYVSYWNCSDVNRAYQGFFGKMNFKIVRFEKYVRHAGIVLYYAAYRDLFAHNYRAVRDKAATAVKGIKHMSPDEVNITAKTASSSSQRSVRSYFYLPQDAETQLEKYKAQKGRIRAPKPQEKIYIDAALSAALVFLQKQYAKNTYSQAPPAEVIDTDTITFGVCFDGKTIHIETPVISNKPLYNLSAIFVYLLANNFAQAKFELFEVFRNSKSSSSGSSWPRTEKALSTAALKTGVYFKDEKQGIEFLKEIVYALLAGNDNNLIHIIISADKQAEPIPDILSDRDIRSRKIVIRKFSVAAELHRYGEAIKNEAFAVIEILFITPGPGRMHIKVNLSSAASNSFNAYVYGKASSSNASNAPYFDISASKLEGVLFPISRIKKVLAEIGEDTDVYCSPSEIAKDRILLYLRNKKDIVARLSMKIMRELALTSREVEFPFESLLANKDTYCERMPRSPLRIYKKINSVACIDYFELAGRLQHKTVDGKKIGQWWYDDYLEPYLVKCGFPVLAIQGNCLRIEYIKKFFSSRGFEGFPFLRMDRGNHVYLGVKKINSNLPSSDAGALTAGHKNPSGRASSSAADVPESKPNPAKIVTEITDANFWEFLKDKTVAVYVGSKSCHPCVLYYPVFKGIARIYANKDSAVKFAKFTLPFTHSEFRWIYLRDNMTIPKTLLIVNGYLKEELVGKVSAETLIKFIDDNIPTVGGVSAGNVRKTTSSSVSSARKSKNIFKTGLHIFKIIYLPVLFTVAMIFFRYEYVALVSGSFILALLVKGAIGATTGFMGEYVGQSIKNERNWEKIGYWTLARFILTGGLTYSVFYPLVSIITGSALIKVLLDLGPYTILFTYLMIFTGNLIESRCGANNKNGLSLPDKIKYLIFYYPIQAAYWSIILYIAWAYWPQWIVIFSSVASGYSTILQISLLKWWIHMPEEKRERYLRSYVNPIWKTSVCLREKFIPRKVFRKFIYKQNSGITKTKYKNPSGRASSTTNPFDNKTKSPAVVLLKDWNKAYAVVKRAPIIYFPEFIKNFQAQNEGFVFRGFGEDGFRKSAQEKKVGGNNPQDGIDWGGPITALDWATYGPISKGGHIGIIFGISRATRIRNWLPNQGKYKPVPFSEVDKAWLVLIDEECERRGNYFIRLAEVQLTEQQHSNEESLAAAGASSASIYKSDILKDQIVVRANNVRRKKPGEILIAVRTLKDLDKQAQAAVIEDFEKQWPRIPYPGIEHDGALRDVVAVLKNPAHRVVPQGALWQPFLAISQGNASYAGKWYVEGIVEALLYKDHAEIICWEIRPDNRRGAASRLKDVVRQLFFHVLNRLTDQYPWDVRISLVG
ncbi:MAG: thioredoxin family protein, partial [Candidatus Omnitrophica bacterium]|nr:thioredoxin family protein [Candidatus Omnitrophota bacterium]